MLRKTTGGPVDDDVDDYMQSAGKRLIRLLGATALSMAALAIMLYFFASPAVGKMVAVILLIVEAYVFSEGAWRISRIIKK